MELLIKIRDYYKKLKGCGLEVQEINLKTAEELAEKILKEGVNFLRKELPNSLSQEQYKELSSMVDEIEKAASYAQ